jgi:hypothetical protein
MVITDVEKTVTFQPEGLVDLEIQTNCSHAVNYKNIII